ncbi:hypothetical protein VOLCADRAFT_104154 [Volvox carteri f. nagariensis]|uniref:CCHC-type domain-containing protein n=3 Tax=Volvox carteri f. nagariensis TaxID=3068 RepID=D8TRL8_VOLCA|nr:uncharacterized protein VOLCADRAFT_104154 [Volvox carteri f. nagariensis]XP_002954873.1 uncharacterized protein VOLCADRAFT_106546 [Volvox carteri f. nagariensis]XP_002959842.1 uncharacterized protein VOLCADRAFT_108765 [Volvox carteri f. nagariensis]EFJ39094.1 hypothetical protein VOLCADRAFT_108765 [Volvox carteri f. nagariensis]EFJ44072.1 hypothetical protein VOLCADRAFT_106546 [Volvox carteri f. nagariensis]EFJ49917.1 hypothetical protein VOLCADRAFT_104154 [Volvox carteri f. nagariensis]|eukprot:XP_002948982.1 hypothetical protein VOLCADRAFT_104154 [Volvox carteri f. nagariensis]
MSDSDSETSVSYNTMYTELKARLVALKENKDVKAAQERRAADPGVILNKQQLAAMDQLNAVKLQLTTIKKLMDTKPDVQAVDGPPAKRARVALEDFKCDFGASEGKANKSLSGQRAHIEKCYNAVMDIEDAWRNVLAARPGEERFRNIEAMETAITDGKAVFRGVAKELVVAYNHGWEVVHEMRGMAYAETEEERKALKQAVKAVAGKKPKQAKPASVPAGSGAGAGVKQAAAAGVCFKCNKPGHFAKECKEK